MKRADAATAAEVAIDGRSPYQQLADLLQQAAELSREIAVERENQVADRAEQSDITSVKLLTVSDLAGRFSVDEKTIRRWRREARLPAAIEIGGVIRWRPEDVDAWIEGQAR